MALLTVQSLSFFVTSFAFRHKVGAHRIKVDESGDHYRYVSGVGEWGGICTCPNGQRFEVGDNNNFCESLFCEGGIAGPCVQGGISVAHAGFGVTCAQATHPTKTIWESYEEAANILRERESRAHGPADELEHDTLEQVRFEEHPSTGYVESVYTFGSPAVARLPFVNGRSPDGCFNGIRTVLDGRDPVPWLAQYAGFRHPMISMYALPPQEGQEALTEECGQPTTWHPPGRIRNVARIGAWTHRQTIYWDRLREQGVANESIHGSFARFAKSVSKPPAVAKEWASIIGWNLVGWANLGTDPVHLYQEPGTHRCAIAFRGSDDPFRGDGIRDWAHNFQLSETEFCNFDRVHSGFVHEFQDIVGSTEFQENIKSKLPMCSEVSTGGHSSGGAVAELFAACANGGTPEPICNETAWPNLEDGMVCGGCRVLMNHDHAHHDEMVPNDPVASHTCASYCQSVDLECMAAWEADGDTCGLKSIISCDEDIGSRTICRCGPPGSHPENRPSLAEASEAEQRRWLTWYGHYILVSWIAGRPQQIPPMELPPI